MFSFKQALECATNLTPLPLTQESTPLFDASYKILATDIFSTFPLPFFDHSAMDGFGIRFNDCKNTIKVTDTLYAGQDNSTISIKENEAVRIMTGAMMPDNIDCVIPFEQASFNEDTRTLTFPTEPKQGANIRHKGEELQAGSLIAKKGSLLDFGLIGLLATQGLATLPTYRSLKIALFSSGDEVKQAGEEILPHQIYDCNSPSLLNALRAHHFACDYLGVLRDDENLESRLLEAASQYDVILTSGGASRGDKDLFLQTLQKNRAEIFCEKINLKPGKPLLISKILSSYVFCLPGNPISAICLLLGLVIPALHALSHSTNVYPQAIKAKITQSITMGKNRAHILLGHLSPSGFTPYNHGKINPNAISQISLCNAFGIFDEGVQEIKENADVLVIPFAYQTCGEFHFINL